MNLRSSSGRGEREVAPPVILAVAPGWGAAPRPARKPTTGSNFQRAGKYRLSTGETLNARQATNDPRNVHGLKQYMIQRRLAAGQVDPEYLFRPPRCVYTLSTGEQMTAWGATNDPRNVHGLGENAISQRLRKGGQSLEPEKLWGPRAGAEARYRFALTTGEVITVPEARADPRNVHQIRDRALRKRLLQGGQWLDPAYLWMPQEPRPNRRRSAP